MIRMPCNDLIMRGVDSSWVVSWPSWPELFDPKVKTEPLEVTAMLWPGPAIAWDFSLLEHVSPANKNLRTNFQEPPHRSFNWWRCSESIGLKIALFWHMSRAASSDKQSSWSGAKWAGCLKKEHVAWKSTRNFTQKSAAPSILNVGVKFFLLSEN